MANDNKREAEKIRRFFNEISKTISSPRAMGEFGALARDIIFTRVKSGFGVSSDKITNPRKQRLKRLSRSYIKQRERDGVKGAFGRPGKSNLTNTGQMLDSMQVDSERQRVRVEVPNTPRDDTTDTNKKIAEYVSTQGRPFFALAPDEQTIITREIEDRVRRAFRKIF